MAKAGRHEIAVGALVLVAMVLLAYMSLKVGAIKSFGDEIEVTSLFPDAAGLAVGASVQEAGVVVGRVSALTVENGQARIHLALRNDAKVRKDATARIRARSVLGEKYVEIVPTTNTAPLLADDDTLQPGPEPVEIDQLVNQMGPVVSAIDPAAISELSQALSAAFKNDPDRANRMMGDLETILHNAAVASADAPALLAEVHQTLASVRRAADAATPVMAHADHAITSLDTATAQLPQTLTDAQGLLTDSRSAVNDGHALISKLDGSTGNLKKLIDNLSEIDKWELRRLLREEGIVVRLKPSTVVPTDEPSK